MRIIHKGYLIQTDKAFPSVYRVAIEGQGGRIPNILSGVFTSPSVAMELIDAYTAQKETSNARKAVSKD